MQYWLVKSEPFKYSWAQFIADKRTPWDGVRNYEARNHLRAMQKGDLALFYHSNEDKAIMGIAQIVKTAYPDSTAVEGDWSVVDLRPYKAFKTPVTLHDIKTDSTLKSMELLRRNRLSVVPVTSAEFNRICLRGEPI
ncbi:MAG: EVE domain-containing protein [Bacteroidota bacterium]|jgi:predicted RNA-binding protein with PUA-like domain